MVDYLAWAKADPLTVEQAARLWAEVDPSAPQYMWTPSQVAEIGARLQMLCGRIATRELQADHRGNGLEFIGRYERSLIFRSELAALAERLGERPRFLFAGSNEASATAPSGSAATKAEPASTPTALSQAGLDKAAISRLFGPKITKTSASSPPPLRVVPGARRISNAPPPPAYYARGTMGSLPSLAPPAALASSKPAGPRVSSVQPNEQSPTYAVPPTYRPDEVPEQFQEWAKARRMEGTIITQELAEEAMRGPKDKAGRRSGGLLKQGPGLSRETVRAWIKTLGDEGIAKRGEPPSRIKNRAEK